jgi:transcriptional regulator with XRE-family HTH domain
MLFFTQYNRAWEQHLDRLRHIREQSGYSQQDLADESGVSQHTISEIELGRRRPQGRTLRKLAKVLDVAVAELYDAPERPLAEAPPSAQLTLNGALEEERRTSALGEQFELWRAGWEEDTARWARAVEEGTILQSPSSAGAFCAEVIAEGTSARATILNDLIPTAEDQLPGDAARRERERFLETATRVEETMLGVVDAVEGIAGPGDVAAAELIRRFLDPEVLKEVDKTAGHITDRPDLELWLRREKRRRRGASAPAPAKAEEVRRQRPTA